MITYMKTIPFLWHDHTDAHILLNSILDHRDIYNVMEKEFEQGNIVSIKIQLKSYLCSHIAYNIYS